METLNTQSYFLPYAVLYHVFSIAFYGGSAMAYLTNVFPRVIQIRQNFIMLYSDSLLP